jgi:hypothetical protein
MGIQIDKDHVATAHNALNTDTVKPEPENETDQQATDRRMNEIANKAAGKGLERERTYESGEIFSK